MKLSARRKCPPALGYGVAFAEEYDREHTGADVSADNGTDVADLDVLAHALDLLAQRLGALDIVGVGDEYRRLLEILAVALEVFDERAVDVALAADLADVDQLADLVAADERLDLQRLAEGCRDC